MAAFYKPFETLATFTAFNVNFALFLGTIPVVPVTIKLEALIGGRHVLLHLLPRVLFRWISYKE